jgi:putative redox protein
MVEINITYEGELRCSATHQPSETTILTDAPVDNHGRGLSFSPTDLLAAALGTCMVTVMSIAAQTLQIDLAGTKAMVRKTMVAGPLRRIGTLTVVIEIPVHLDEERKEKLEKAALTCPVHQSMHPDVQIPVSFRWAS